MKLSERERRLLRALGGVALVGAAIWAFRFGAGWKLGPTWNVESLESPLQPGQRVRRRASQKLPDTVVPLELSRLERQARDFVLGRDPFRFGPLPPPPPPPAPSPEELERRRREEEERRRKLAEEAAERARPRPPEVPFRYLGNFGPRNGKIAVLLDSRYDEVLNVREGEVLEGKFRVVRIGYESLDIEFVEFPEAPARRLAIGG
jgi:hypothetical protein